MARTIQHAQIRHNQLYKIADVKERIDYVILLSIIAAIGLGSFAVIDVWLVMGYLALVFVYHSRWSNEAIIKRHESLDSSYEFNESNYRRNEKNLNENCQQIAYDAAQVLLNEFEKDEIIERSGKRFYHHLVSTVKCRELPQTSQAV